MFFLQLLCASAHSFLRITRNASSQHTSALFRSKHLPFVQLKISDIDLRFLVHFVGDVHQPLHLMERERGGSSLRFDFLFH